MNTWDHIRSLFPVTRRWAFFDHAAVSPIPTTAAAELARYAQVVSENGIAAVADLVAGTNRVRNLAARLINAPAVDDVMFVPNTTIGIGLIAEGFPWKAGENVVLAAEEYPSNQYPWLNLQDRGVEVRRVPSRGNRVSLDDVAAAIDGKTRVLSASAVQFASGFRADLDALGELCRSRGVFFFVDAIQALGVFPIDVQRTPIDALAADGHKWMLAPEGAGFAYVRREWVDRLHPIGVGAHSVVNPFEYHKVDFRLKPHAGRWEGGALNVPGLWALGASLDVLLGAGIPNVAARILELTDYLCEQVKAAGCEVFSCREGDARSGIVSFTKPGCDQKDVM
ncbi:MAG: aminotransferase class V-fold PLP-dependent enzyme, partial [Fimbriiglobus sp.]|nr:aminotransferase class V-fold PLP-dependent enzyme [Fimbriiglobus sp.]